MRTKKVISVNYQKMGSNYAKIALTVLIYSENMVMNNALSVIDPTSHVNK
jgi:hypothetical protein